MSKREIKFIKGMGEVLKKLSKETEEKGYFEKKDLELLKKVGSNILFQGVTLDYTQKIKGE